MAMKRSLIALEILAGIVLILALVSHPATDQSWWSYLISLANRAWNR